MRRAHVLAVTALLGAAAACGGQVSSDAEVAAPATLRPSTRSPGVTLEQYCSMGRPAITDISARTHASAVVVEWREFFGASEDRTFFVYRRGGSTGAWHRIARVVAAPSARRTYTDSGPFPEAGVLQYGVTEMYECGESPLCNGTGPARQCSLAEVRRKSPD